MGQALYSLPYVNLVCAVRSAIVTGVDADGHVLAVSEPIWFFHWIVDSFARTEDAIVPLLAELFPLVLIEYLDLKAKRATF